jgi:hypothetical protein
VYESTNPGKTKYIVKLEENGGDSFETLIDTLLVEQGINNFDHFVTTGTQYDDGDVFGEIFFTTSGQPNSADVEFKQYNNQSEIFNTSATNGSYNLQVPIVHEAANPGQTKYIITIEENGGDAFQTLVDTLLIAEGVNTLEHYVEPPSTDPDTVYTQTVISNVLLDAIGYEGATISYTMLDTITGNQVLVREAVTNSQGQDIVASLPIVKHPGTTGLGASQYIMNISHDNLETLIDTVLVQEDTEHEFFFNVTETGSQYEDGDVWGQIFFVDGGQSPSNADVEYKQLNNQSQIFNTTAPNGVYNIQVPIVFEAANPGQTKYIVTIEENGGDEFQTLVDTLLVSEGVNGFTHYVEETGSNPTQTIEGIIRNVYSKQAESGVTIRVINRSNGSLIEEDITTSNGQYSFPNIPAGTLVEFELGKPGELWVVNSEYDVPENITEPTVTFNRYFYPKTVEVPQVGSNSNIEGGGEEVAEMVGDDFINFEEILRDTDYMWANGSGSESARTWIENNFYEGNSPITTASTQRNITETMQQNYEPYTNFYSGQLGWNVNFGSGNLTTPLFSTTNYGVFAVIGGEIMTTEGGSEPLAPVIKELQGRRLQLGSVNSRISMMNASASMPTSKDRAYVYIIRINQDGRFDTEQETYSLEYATSVEPVSGSRGYSKDGNYVDKPGNKPHCKSHFNHKKYREQLEHPPLSL